VNHGQQRGAGGGSHQQLTDLGRSGRIECSGGLVGQNQARALHQHAGYADLLFLAARELVGPGCGAGQHADLLQRRIGPLDLGRREKTCPAAPAADPPQSADQYVVQRGQPPHQMQPLHDLADLPPKQTPLPGIE
jgi:hypothetical protein